MRIFRHIRGYLLLILLSLNSSFINAQNEQESRTDTTAQRTRVELLHANEGRMDKKMRPDVQLLIGDVQLRHDSMYMYCDSAFIYEKTNSVEAFSNVRMEQGDTLFIYGDYLFYDGISQLAQLRDNVKLENRNTTLLTDSLNYDRVFDLGYYFEGGTLQDEANVLTSYWGEYSPTTKLAVFNQDVQLVNDRFVLTSDTLKYNTNSKVATILGPSHIVSDDNHIYSERGLYDTANEQAELLDRSALYNNGKKLVGDSLFYDRRLGYGEVFADIVMNDSINRSMLKGDYCYYDELSDSAFVTKKALAIDYSQGDSLFMHADTFAIVSRNLKTDSLYREMRAFHKVRMYRHDLQGVCDSLAYNSKDSCLTFFRDPILWNQGQQLLGEEIRVYMNDSTIDWAHIVRQALTVEKKDSIHYNQVSGKELKAYFENGEISHVQVVANVRVVYYPQQEDSTMIGMNTSETSLLDMYMENRKIKKMVMSPKSNGVLYPMDQIPSDKMQLSSFKWFSDLRPKSKYDIFDWRGKKEGETLQQSTRKREERHLRDLIKM